jgi:hypothetical protein
MSLALPYFHLSTGGSYQTMDKSTWGMALSLFWDPITESKEVKEGKFQLIKDTIKHHLATE